MGNTHCEGKENILELRGRRHAIYLANPYESVAVVRSMFCFGIAWIVMAAVGANKTLVLLVWFLVLVRNKNSSIHS